MNTYLVINKTTGITTYTIRALTRTSAHAQIRELVGLVHDYRVEWA